MSSLSKANEVDAAVESTGRDLYDAISFTEPTNQPSYVQNLAVMPVARDSHFYNMKHPKRGKAVIFNHITFDKILQLNRRAGSEQDCTRLCEELSKLDFELEVHTNLKAKDIDIALHDLAQDYSNEESDCILIAVFSHGDANQIFASDNPYKPEMLWSPFTADRCRHLAGKPKFFIIQACQGDKVEEAVTLMPNRNTAVDSCTGLSYKIPNHADFLIAYSTIPGFYSWRNTTDGSWFIQALCKALREYAHREDFLSVLTIASRIVATEYQSNTPMIPAMHEKKQIPCLTSLLTRKVMFHPKPKRL